MEGEEVSVSENAGGPHHTALVCAVRPCRTGSWPALPRDEQYPAFHDCSASSQQHAWWKEGEWGEGRREVERGKREGREKEGSAWGEEEGGRERERGEEGGRAREKGEEEGERRGWNAIGRKRGKRE